MLEWENISRINGRRLIMLKVILQVLYSYISIQQYWKLLKSYIYENLIWFDGIVRHESKGWIVDSKQNKMCFHLMDRLCSIFSWLYWQTILKRNFNCCLFSLAKSASAMIEWNCVWEVSNENWKWLNYRGDFGSKIYCIWYTHCSINKH